MDLSFLKDLVKKSFTKTDDRTRGDRPLLPQGAGPVTSATCHQDPQPNSGGTVAAASATPSQCNPMPGGATATLPSASSAPSVSAVPGAVTIPGGAATPTSAVRTDSDAEDNSIAFVNLSTKEYFPPNVTVDQAVLSKALSAPRAPGAPHAPTAPLTPNAPRAPLAPNAPRASGAPNFEKASPAQSAGAGSPAPDSARITAATILAEARATCHQPPVSASHQTDYATCYLLRKLLVSPEKQKSPSPVKAPSTKQLSQQSSSASRSLFRNPPAATHSVPGAATHSVPGAATHSVPGAATHSVPGAATHFVPGASTHSVPGAATHSVPVAATHSGPGTATISLKDWSQLSGHPCQQATASNSGDSHNLAASTITSSSGVNANSLGNSAIANSSGVTANSKSSITGLSSREGAALPKLNIEATHLDTYLLLLNNFQEGRPIKKLYKVAIFKEGSLFWSCDPLDPSLTWTKDIQFKTNSKCNITFLYTDKTRNAYNLVNFSSCPGSKSSFKVMKPGQVIEVYQCVRSSAMFFTSVSAIWRINTMFYNDHKMDWIQGSKILSSSIIRSLDGMSDDEKLIISKIEVPRGQKAQPKQAKSKQGTTLAPFPAQLSSSLPTYVGGGMPTSGGRGMLTSGGRGIPTSGGGGMPTSSGGGMSTSSGGGIPTSGGGGMPTSGGGHMSTSGGGGMPTSSGGGMLLPVISDVMSLSAEANNPGLGNAFTPNYTPWGEFIPQTETGAGGPTIPSVGMAGSPAGMVAGSPASMVAGSPASMVTGSPASMVAVPSSIQSVPLDLPAASLGISAVPLSRLVSTLNMPAVTEARTAEQFRRPTVNGSSNVAQTSPTSGLTILTISPSASKRPAQSGTSAVSSSMTAASSIITAAPSSVRVEGVSGDSQPNSGGPSMHGHYFSLEVSRAKSMTYCKHCELDYVFLIAYLHHLSSGYCRLRVQTIDFRSLQKAINENLPNLRLRCIYQSHRYPACKKNFDNVFRYCLHVDGHVHGHLYSCYLCCTVFSQVYVFFRHRCLNQPIVTLKRRRRQPNDPTPKTPYPQIPVEVRKTLTKCPYCSAQFNYISGMLLHLCTHDVFQDQMKESEPNDQVNLGHILLDKLGPAGRESVVCHICQEELVNPLSYCLHSDHHKIELETFRCKKCFMNHKSVCQFYNHRCFFPNINYCHFCHRLEKSGQPDIEEIQLSDSEVEPCSVVPSVLDGQSGQHDQIGINLEQLDDLSSDSAPPTIVEFDTSIFLNINKPPVTSSTNMLLRSGQTSVPAQLSTPITANLSSMLSATPTTALSAPHSAALSASISTPISVPTSTALSAHIAPPVSRPVSAKLSRQDIIRIFEESSDEDSDEEPPTQPPQSAVDRRLASTTNTAEGLEARNREDIPNTLGTNEADNSKTGDCNAVDNLANFDFDGEDLLTEDFVGADLTNTIDCEEADRSNKLDFVEGETYQATDSGERDIFSTIDRDETIGSNPDSIKEGNDSNTVEQEDAANPCFDMEKEGDDTYVCSDCSPLFLLRGVEKLVEHTTLLPTHSSIRPLWVFNKAKVKLSNIGKNRDYEDVIRELVESVISAEC